MVVKNLRDVIIKWAKEKAAQGEIEFNESVEAFLCEKYIRYRTQATTKLILDNEGGIGAWGSPYHYFYEIDLQYKTILRLQLSFYYKNISEESMEICEKILREYKMDSRKENEENRGFFRWACKFDVKIDANLTEEGIKLKMDQLFYQMQGYETFLVSIIKQKTDAVLKENEFDNKKASDSVDNTLRDKLMVCFPYGFYDSTISSRDDIYKIVSGSAYKDMTPRHLKGIGKHPNEKKEIFNYITDQIVYYFSQPAKNKDEFDRWQKDLCEEICRRFSAIPDIELKFGKAQKLVNITFKCLYCFPDADSKSDHFKYCHIPIDNNVIDWCNNNLNISSSPTVWSFMEYSDYQRFEDSLYLWLNSNNNTYYRDSDGTPYSLLQLDFIAWISNSKTRKGIIDTWCSIRKSSELWKKYRETVMATFPELGK